MRTFRTGQEGQKRHHGCPGSLNVCLSHVFTCFFLLRRHGLSALPTSKKLKEAHGCFPLLFLAALQSRCTGQYLPWVSGSPWPRFGCFSSAKCPLTVYRVVTGRSCLQCTAMAPPPRHFSGSSPPDCGTVGQECVCGRGNPMHWDRMW